MNILFRDGCNEKTAQLINMVRESISPQLSIIVSLEETRNILKRDGNELFLDYHLLMEGRYDDDIVLPPIDENILLQLSPYYNEILRIIGRNGALYYSYPKREELFLRIVRYWDWALDYYKIDLYLGFAVPHFSFEIIIYYLCKIKKIKTLFTWHTSVYPYMHFVQDLDQIGHEVQEPYLNNLKLYKDIDVENIHLNEDFQKNFNLHTTLNGDRVPFYMKGSSLNQLIIRMKGVFSYYKYLKTNQKKLFRAAIFKKYKSIDSGNYMKEYNKNVSKICYNSNTSYIYVPLHLQPEATTCPLGGVYANQLLMISMLSYHLPTGVYLYVKENPKQDNSDRSLDFLAELLKLKNVKLLSLKEDTFNLIENCLAVATVTGTVGWEALLRKKPVIIFGKHINRFAPGVFKVRDNSDCQRALEAILKHEVDELLFKKIKLFMLAMRDVCFKSKVLSEMPIEDKEIQEDLKQTCDAISNKIISIYE